jgi:hypothetical protein
MTSTVVPRFAAEQQQQKSKNESYNNVTNHMLSDPKYHSMPPLLNSDLH